MGKKIKNKSSEGEKNDKIAESSEQISSMDQETTEKSDKEFTSNEIDLKTEEIETIGSIDEIDESPVESKDNIESSEQVSECEIKDEIKDIEKEEEAKNMNEKSTEEETKQETLESSEQVSSKYKDTTEISSEGEAKHEKSESSEQVFSIDQDTTEKLSESK